MGLQTYGLTDLLRFAKLLFFFTR